MSDSEAGFPDPEHLASAAMSRRSLLVSGAAGLATMYGATASKGAAATFGRWSGLAGAAGTVSFGSNASDPVPKAAYANVFKAFTKQTGTKVSVNTVDHNTFQEQINTYLQGQP